VMGSYHHLPVGLARAPCSGHFFQQKSVLGMPK
jgi:hypothetical protein